MIPIGDHALITADHSIAKAARQQGLDLLQIRPGAVLLPGYDCGFIGGAASHSPYTESDRVFFCGDLHSHPDADAIETFCHRHGKAVISLSDESLLDVGTIFTV